MTRYLQIINIRTFTVLIICLATSFSVLKYQIKYNFDLTIISIAIIFPLVFTIRAAFRRREKAMDYLSKFKGSLLIVSRCFERCKNLPAEKQTQIQAVIRDVSESLINFFTKGTHDQAPLRANLRKVSDFLMVNREEIGGGEAFKILRFMKDVHGSIEGTISIYTHHTPVSLRAYCQVFIYVFPFIYSPALLHRLEDGTPNWVVYALSSITGFILISLFNVQDQMENPFDAKGLDDIRVHDFAMER